jgi:hypothetical protein
MKIVWAIFSLFARLLLLLTVPCALIGWYEPIIEVGWWVVYCDDRSS